MIDNSRTLTYGQLTSSNPKVVPRVESAEKLKTPREYIEKAIAVGVEIQKHFSTENDFISLRKDAILPYSIQQRFYELVDYHNQLYPNDPIRV